MWIVYISDQRPARFADDTAAQRYMLNFLEDETLNPVDSITRSRMICQLYDAFNGRTQLRESWGIEGCIKAVFKEF